MPPPPAPALADEFEGRVRAVERGHDILEGRVGRVESDIRVYQPLPLDNEKLRSELAGLAKDVHEAHEGIRRLEVQFREYAAEQQRIREERERKERERDEREREREKLAEKEKVDRAATERRDRWTRVAVILTLSLAFVSLTINTLLQALT